MNALLRSAAAQRDTGQLIALLFPNRPDFTMTDDDQFRVTWQTDISVTFPSENDLRDHLVEVYCAMAHVAEVSA